MQIDQIIKNAVCLKNFDTMCARIPMSPLGRIPIRPADLQGEPRCGAVMIVLFEQARRLHVVLIKRRDDLRHHPGQISFPGGRREPGEEPLTCALRETREEISLAAETLNVAGCLSPAYIVASDFLIHPFVAWHHGIPDCEPDPREVEDIVSAPLSLLDTCEARRHATKNVLGSNRSVPGFSFLNYHIWGATAMLLHETIERLKAAGWKE